MSKYITTYPYKEKSEELGKLPYNKLPDQLQDDLNDMFYPCGAMVFRNVENEWNEMPEKERIEFVAGIRDLYGEKK